MTGPFYLGQHDGKVAIVDAAGRLISRETAKRFLEAFTVTHLDLSPGQIEQQHRDIAARFQRRGGR